MASEIQCSGPGSGKTLYALIRGYSFNIGMIWQTTTNTFVAYVTANYANYTISLTEQGTASNFYTGNFPTAIPPGSYSVVVKQQIGGAAAETDSTVAAGNIEWNGTYPEPVSDLATSGLIGIISPIKIYRGEMVQNFMFKLVSAADHVTPFVSGIVSGQINRDAGGFGVLQSGAFTEQGHGWYNLQALTSGDLLANSVALFFTAAGVSGGNSDQRDFSFILQKASGST